MRKARQSQWDSGAGTTGSYELVTAHNTLQYILVLWELVAPVWVPSGKGTHRTLSRVVEQRPQRLTSHDTARFDGLSRPSTDGLIWPTSLWLVSSSVPTAHLARTHLGEAPPQRLGHPSPTRDRRRYSQSL
jgi:hypothetical protein